MSNLGVLLSLLALLGGGVAVNLYGAARSQALGELITTGVSSCGPVSVRARWLTLFNVYLPNVAFLAAFTALCAMGLVEVGRAVTDDGVRMLANLIAAFAGFGSLFILIQGGSLVLIHASNLRKASQLPTNPKN